MSFKMNKNAYQKLIDENISEIEKYMPDSLERRHTIDILKESVRMHYNQKPVLLPSDEDIEKEADIYENQCCGEGESPAFESGAKYVRDLWASSINGEVKTGWISVKERLPEIDQRFHGFVHGVIHYDCGAYTGTWSDDDRRKTMLVKGITHWQPLQTPPVISEEKGNGGSNDN
jgi:hypothetical protein